MTNQTRPTIVIFSHAYLPFLGGAETAVKGVTDELGDFNFVMLTGRYQAGLPREEKIGNISVYRLGLGFSFDKFLLPALAFFKFLSLGRKLPRPILFWGIMISYSSLAARFLKYFSPKVPFLLNIQEGNKEWERNRFWWRFVLRKVDCVTAISSFLMEEAERAGYKGGAKIVPNGVDLEKFSTPDVQKALILSQKLGIRPDEKIIVTVSRLTHKNAVDMIVRALLLLKIPARLLVVGGGEKKTKLLRLVQELNLEKRVIFAENVYEETPFYLKLGHIFVRPSRSEGLGTAFLEAMAAGLPVVATSVGGIKDFLQDGETGLEVKVDDPEDLAQKLDLLLSDEALRQKLIQNGRRLVEEKYQWSQIASAMREIFNSLLFPNSLPAGRQVKNMRILIATGIYPPDIGGPATYAKFLAEEFPKHGHEAEVLVFSRLLGYPKGIRHLIYFWQVLKSARKCDVVLTTDPVSAGLPVHAASFFAQKPYVLKIGGDYVWEQGTQRWGVEEFLDDFLKNKYGFKIELLRKLQAHVAKGAVKVIAPSNYLVSVVQMWGVKKENIAVIYNKITPLVLLSKDAARAKLGVRGDEIILFSFGRDVPWKGFKMLREIMPEVQKEFTKARLVAGEISREERDLWLASADIFLQNTGYEGFPHQLLEAMSAGLPIITTPAGGNMEVVEDGESAVLVAYNDKKAWVGAILKLLRDGTLRQKLSSGAKLRAKYFMDKDIIGETLSVLEKISFSNS